MTTAKHLMKAEPTKIGEHKGIEIYASDNGVTVRSQSSKPWLPDSKNRLLSVTYNILGQQCGYSTSPGTDPRTLVELAKEEIDTWLPRIRQKQLPRL